MQASPMPSCPRCACGRTSTVIISCRCCRYRDVLFRSVRLYVSPAAFGHVCACVSMQGYDTAAAVVLDINIGSFDNFDFAMRASPTPCLRHAREELTGASRCRCRCRRRCVLFFRLCSHATTFVWVCTVPEHNLSKSCFGPGSSTAFM